VGKSNHCIVGFQILANGSKDKKKTPIKNYNRADFTAMSNDPSTVDWEKECSPTKSCDKIYSKFLSIMSQAEEKHVSVAKQCKRPTLLK
jgi:hypothetical protein